MCIRDRVFFHALLGVREDVRHDFAGLAAGALTATGLTAAAAAQDATPATGQTRPEPEMLYLQSFQSGSIAPKDGEDGTFTLTLEQGLGQTIYFSDRPERIVGAMPTEYFLDTLGFPADDPPNAALLIERASGEVEIAVVELFNPVWDGTSPGVTYDVQVLAEWEQTLELGLQTTPNDLAALDPALGSTHLFIDGNLGCPDRDMRCVTDRHNPETTTVGMIPNADHGGYCYYGGETACMPCDPWNLTTTGVLEYWNGQCNQRFAECNGQCTLFNFCSRDAPFGHTYCQWSYDCLLYTSPSPRD